MENNKINKFDEINEQIASHSVKIALLRKERDDLVITCYEALVDKANFLTTQKLIYAQLAQQTGLTIPLLQKIIKTKAK